MIFGACAFAESALLDWKGSEAGLSENPRWLKTYTKKNSVERIRSDFSLEKDALIFVGSGIDADLDGALQKARADACQKASKKLGEESGMKEGAAVRISGLVPVYSFWLQYGDFDSEGEQVASAYKAYETHTATKKSWNASKAAVK